MLNLLITSQLALVSCPWFCCCCCRTSSNPTALPTRTPLLHLLIHSIQLLFIPRLCPRASRDTADLRDGSRSHRRLRSPSRDGGAGVSRRWTQPCLLYTLSTGNALRRSPHCAVGQGTHGRQPLCIPRRGGLGPHTFVVGPGILPRKGWRGRSDALLC